MIKLTKAPVPEVLERNGEAWTRDYLNYLNQGQEAPEHLASQYRHVEIKLTVKEETSDKCAYCESKLSHVYHGDVEHIKPKKRYPALRYTWDNLTFVCAICNNSKRDNEIQLNPYIIEPSQHMQFYGCGIISISMIGKEAIEVIDLNRTSLIEKRKDKFDRLIQLQNAYLEAQKKGIDVVIERTAEALRAEGLKSSEHSALAQGFLKISQIF